KRLLPKRRTTRTVSLREFYERKNKVLIIRRARGLGDIFMCRMMFEDFKRVMPDMHLVFACPRAYHDAIKDHPYIDEVIDTLGLEDKTDYPISYDISTCCIRWECGHAPFANKHRA